MNPEMIYRRAVALCALKWGRPPYVIHRMGQAGKIAVEDVIELLIITNRSDLAGGWVTGYLFPKGKEFVSKKGAELRQSINLLASKLLAEPDHEKKAVLKLEIDKLSEDLQNGR
jgi:hypothetical protein